jgi:hypothetical protein
MRDGSYFSFPLALTNGINGLLWTVYGLALGDWLIAAPSIVAVISSTTQVRFYSAKYIYKSALCNICISKRK